MYDIEVIDGHNYAIICQGSNAYEFLKAMNSKLVMKKLASEPGDQLWLTAVEVNALCRGFRRNDLQRLVSIGLLDYQRNRRFETESTRWTFDEAYDFTEYGLEVVKWIKDTNEDVEIFLN